MSGDEKMVVEPTLRKESKKDKKERKKEKKEKKSKKEVEDKEEDEEDEVKEDKEDEESGSDSDHEGRKDYEEIEIDLNADLSLSKKQQRLLKKGKLNLDKLKKKRPAPKEEGKEEETPAVPKKSPYAIWVGNLSFDTTKEDLIRFIVGKTAGYAAASEDSEDGLCKIEEDDISRVNLPKKENKIKGFAYIDFPSAKHVKTGVSLSEQILNGRKLLIKDSTSFEGRPATAGSAEGAPGTGAPLSKNPPSRILFVGNLSFDTSEDNLEEHFRHCGDIVRIRMATFEDSGKCKGFAFIDFKDEEGPTTALKSKLAKKLINRPLRLEYGEDRSKRNPGQKIREERMKAGREGGEEGGDMMPFRAREREFTRAPREREAPRARESWEAREKREAREAAAAAGAASISATAAAKPAFKPKKRENDAQQLGNNKRLKSSIALATAQRASAAIVPSQGKKISFD